MTLKGTVLLRWSRDTAKAVQKALCSLRFPILKNTDLPRDNYAYMLDRGWVHSEPTRLTYTVELIAES